MRVRFVDDGHIQFPATPRIDGQVGFPARASGFLGGAGGLAALKAYLEVFGAGWLCGFMAGAGLAGIFLNH